MSRKQKKFSADFKAKIVLEALSGELTISEIASKYSIISKNILNWKKEFLSNASLIFDKKTLVSDYKETLTEKTKEIDELHRQLGKRTAELEWAAKKLMSLDFKVKKSLIKSEPNSIAVSKQCELINLHRSTHYYKKVGISERKQAILEEIDLIYQELPFYGYRKVYYELRERGFSVGINQVSSYMKELGLKTIYPAKKVQTTIANIEHKKYPYLLRDIDINQANQVWSTDITYIKVDGGFVYLAAIIDWYSKAILAYKISNTMDESLVLSVVKDALYTHKKPKIFNTDQGSQYTSNAHVDLLTENDIQISMDGKGKATNNIAIERFWRSAKYENIYLNEYASISQLKDGVKEYVEFYNFRRFHQSLNYKKPMELYLESANEEFPFAA